MKISLYPSPLILCLEKRNAVHNNMQTSKTGKTTAELIAINTEYYKNEHFVRVLDEASCLKQNLLQI
jgi:N-acetyl-gamma-glutamylphosphate reductase